MKPLPYRFWIGVMIFFTSFTNYMLRANISVSIIEMVGHDEEKHVPVCTRYETDDITNGKENTPEVGEDKFDWDENQVGDILAGYFYGYVAGNIPAGLLSELVGPRHVIMWTSVTSMILTGLTPLSTKAGHYGLMANRILVGIMAGFIWPALNTLVANWAPPKEKGKFMAATMGNNLGAVFSFSIVGLVTHYWGWPWGFYVLVVAMAIFCLSFWFFVADKPSQSKWTTEEECNFILQEQEGHLSSKKAVAPYRKMLTSVPFWAMSAAHFGSLWGLNLIITYPPKLFSETLGFELKVTAGLAALPYISRLIFSGFFGEIADMLRKADVMSVTHIRKFFIIFSHFLPAVCLFLIPAAGCSPLGVVILLVANQGLNAAVVASHVINTQDLTPNFAGSCFAIMNFIGMISGIFVPKVTGLINVYYKRELKAAALIFMIAGILLAVTGLVFMIFGSGKVQSWNEIKESEATTERT